MTDRIQKLYQSYKDNYNNIKITVTKMRCITETLKQFDGYPPVVKRAWGYARYMDERNIFIEDGQLLAGDIGVEPHSTEFCPSAPAWPDDDFDNILKSGITIDPEDRKYLRSLDEFWSGTGRCMSELECYYYDHERLWDFRVRGMVLPAYTSKKVGFSNYQVGWGWGLNPVLGLNSPDIEMHLYTGFDAFIEKLKERKENIRFTDMESMQDYEFCNAAIVQFEAVKRIAIRYAELAEKKAAECADPKRKQELLNMAAACRVVPAKGATNFREAMQAINFYWCILGSGVTGLNRLDKILWPFLKKDLEEGTITMEEAEDYIQCFRLKIADYVQIAGMPTQREKWAGRARWNNIVLGGTDRDGNDITNPVTYLFLKCATDLKIPHPTMTIRVSKKTPPELMVEAMRCVKTGVGYPAFISEDMYMDYIVEHTHGKIDRREAHDFMLNGCMDVGLPGRSRQTGVPMLSAPIVMELTIDGGEDKLKHTHMALEGKKLSECESFEEFYALFLRQMRHMLSMNVETNNLRFYSRRLYAQDAMYSCFFHDAEKVCRDFYWREMPLEQANSLNIVGMATTIDSLSAIKKLCYDDKTVSPETMFKALRANWEGYEDVRQMCLACPKYGNDDDYADSIGTRLWDDIFHIMREFKGPFGNEINVSAISITAHGPGGKLTGATANGRFAGEVLSDASLSPSQGADTNGPTAVIRSAMKMSKGWSATLHNMKFDPSALKTDEDLNKLGELTKIYLTNGGHQIQYNVVRTEDLIEAKKEPEKHSDIIVRVAGYSTYFTALTPAMQTDVINRTINESV